MASGGHSAGGLGLIGHLSAFYMDPENEFNPSGTIGSCLGTLGTFLFLGTFLCHQGDVREFSWLCLVCLFSCVLYLANSSLALKIGFSWKRKHPSLSLGVLRNTVALPRLQFCCRQAVVEPTQLIITAHVCIWEIFTFPSRRKCVGRYASSLVAAFLGVLPTWHPWVCSAVCTWLTELCIFGRTVSKIHCL